MTMSLIDRISLTGAIFVENALDNVRTLADVMKIIEDEPAIDPESVRPQGKWISRFARHWKGKDECSECGFHEKDHRDLSHHNYCPNCGAKMKGAGD